MFRTALLLPLAMVSLALLAYLAADYHVARQSMVQDSQGQAAEATRLAARELDASLGQAHETVSRLARRIGEGELAGDKLVGALEAALAANPDAAGLGVSYLPHVHAHALREDNPFYVRRAPAGPNAAAPVLAAVAAPVQIAESATGTLVTIGEVFVDYSGEALRAAVRKLQFGTTGYGFVISRDGTFIYHPNEELVLTASNIFQLADAIASESLRDIAERARNGETGVADYQNEISGERSWIFYEPIEATGWSLAGVFQKRDILVSLETLNLHRVVLALGGSAAVLCVLALLARRALRGETGVWLATGAVFAVLSANIVYVCYLAVESSHPASHDHVVVLSDGESDRFLEPWINRTQESTGSSPTLVPTGLHLKSLELSGVSTINATGYVWQKYPVADLDRTTPGIDFANAVELELDEYYRHRDTEWLTIGWRFRVSFEEDLDYSKYPFDKLAAALRLQHGELEKAVVLVPDFSGYQLVNPTALPGVSDTIVLAGWTLNQSYFYYAPMQMLANIGIADNPRQRLFPELHFAVTLKREFLTPLVTNMLPVGVAVSILFGFIVMLHRNPKEMDEFGLTAARLLGSCTALFFGVLLAHIKLRNNLLTESLIYLEYFYFVAYAAIVFVSIAGLVLTSQARVGFFTYRDSILPKVLFWPVIQTSLLVVTISTFFL